MHGTARVPAEKAVLSYWTPARPRAAKSANVIVAGNRPKALPPAASVPGKPGHIAWAACRTATRQRSPSPAGRRRRPPSPTPIPTTCFEPSPGLWPTYPYEVNGKLFFVNNGSGFVCSATAVASASGTALENEIWTAGHCLVNTEGNVQVVDSSAVFIPAYNGNVPNFDPYGEFAWNGGWSTSSAWYYHSDLTEDEAAMTVGTSTKTRPHQAHRHRQPNDRGIERRCLEHRLDDGRPGLHRRA
jgi:hypothetical protein